MENLSEERLANYKGIQDVGFRDYLISIDEFLDRKSEDGSVVLTDFGKHPYPALLHLRTKDMQRILKFSIDSGVIDYIKLEDSQGKLRKHAFDKQSCLAFSSIAWITKRMFSKEAESLAYIEGSWQNFPWKDIVDSAKTALGNNPLTDRIHLPKESIIIEKEGRILKPKVKERLFGIEAVFPEFDDEELEILETVDLISLITRIASLPPGQVEQVSFTKHGALDPIVRAALCNYWASEGKLEKFDRYDDTCSIHAFRESLIRCRNILLKRNTIPNMRGLYDYVKGTVLKEKDKTKFWNPPKPIS